MMAGRMDDKYSRIRVYKQLTKILWDYGFDKENAMTILGALDSEEEENLLKDFLETSPNLVESEVYDYMIRLTNGRFQKEFNSARSAKRRYMNGHNERDLHLLLAELEKSLVYTIEKWNISKEEETRLKDAEAGDTIRIESRREPVLLEDSEKDRILMPVYTSDMEISADKKREYTVSSMSFQSIVTYMCRLSECLSRDAALILDGDGKEPLIIPGSVLSERIP